jgi:hypothetical protein
MAAFDVCAGQFYNYSKPSRDRISSHGMQITLRRFCGKGESDVSMKFLEEF